MSKAGSILGGISKGFNFVLSNKKILIIMVIFIFLFISYRNGLHSKAISIAVDVLDSRVEEIRKNSEEEMRQREEARRLAEENWSEERRKLENKISAINKEARVLRIRNSELKNKIIRLEEDREKTHTRTYTNSERDDSFDRAIRLGKGLDKRVR